LELTTKRSNKWYILPIVLGFLGGIIAALIIRKNDPRKALICVIVGIAVSGLWIVWLFSIQTERDFVPTEEPIDKGIGSVLTYGNVEQKLSIQEMKTLPASCSGVNSMELDIYPTGKQCFSALNKRVEEWCLSESNGNSGLADDCVTQFYLKLAQQCKDPAIGSVEVCLMYTLKELYPKLIPE